MTPSASNARRDRLAQSSEPRFALGDWMSTPDWITVREAAELAGYKIRYLRLMVQDRKIRAQKLQGGREWLIDQASLQAYVKQMKQLGDEKYNPFREKNGTG